MKARHMFSGLQYLDLSCNNIGNDGVPILARSDLVSLVCFNFYYLAIWEMSWHSCHGKEKRLNARDALSLGSDVTSCD